MSKTNNSCQLSCVGTTVAASAIIGIITAIFRYTGVITVTPAFLWTLFGVAVVYLGIMLLTSVFAENCLCCSALKLNLIGSMGTALCSVIMLGVSFEATSTIGAVISGGLLFFLSVLLIGTACLVKCRYDCD